MEWITSRLSSRQDPGVGTSLLSDWKKYESGSADVESGKLRSSDATSSSLKSSVDGASAKVAGLFQASISTIQSGMSTLPTALPTSLPTLETFSIPSGQQLAMFCACVLAGGFFLMISFTIFLPTIILTPSKFALSFTLGCLCIMGGFTVLKGWKQQLSHMLQADRLPFSAAYVGSVLATLYVSLVMKSYLMSLFCSGLQMVAIMYYAMSYFPGGTAGVKFMLSFVVKAAYTCFGGLQRTILG